MLSSTWVINLATTTILFTESLDFSKNSVCIYHFDQRKQLLIFNSGYFIHIVVTKSTITNTSSSCRASVIHSCLQVSIKQLSDRSEYNATVNLYSPNVSVNLYSFMPPPINQSQDGLGVRDALRTSRGVRTMFVQSERGYSVRHGVYVRFSTNQSTAIAYVTGCTYAFRPIRARLWRTSRGVRTLFDQSEHGYSVRHRVYVRFSTNQSTGIAYVTRCTYAFRPIGARRSRILISAAPCGGLRPPRPPCAPLKIRLENLLLYY